MTVFYDPKTKQPRVWIIIIFVLIPLLVLSIFYAVSYIKQMNHVEEEEIDIFAREF
jgi:uncharacterized protein YpmB